MFGAEYVSQHVRQEYAREQKDELWRAYVADTLRCINESSAKYGGGPYMKDRWLDIANQKARDRREPGEIAAQVIERAGLVVVSRKEAERSGV